MPAAGGTVKRGPIGYYVHHQGDGHRQRALAIAGLRPERIVLIGTGLAGTSPHVRRVCMDDDRPAPDVPVDALSALDCLHYAPVNHAGIQQRVARMAAWIAHERPALIVVDVSVEIAMLARLTSVPVVYVRLSGIREDAAHQQAFRGSQSLLAPFHADLDDPALPEWVSNKTRHFPGLTRRTPSTAPAAEVVLWVNGRGGDLLDGNALAEAAIAMPAYDWRVIGPVAPPACCPANLALLGWVDDAEKEIANAGVVIGSAGDGVVNAVIAAARPFVCVPQPRPYVEQVSKAQRLAALGAAVVLEHLPPAALWPAVLRQARALNPANLARLDDVDGCRKACEYLCALADR